jgi:hypothetical protein
MAWRANVQDDNASAQTTVIEIADPDEVAPSYEEVDPEWVAFWTGTPRYRPWKDVASFFRERANA